MLIQKNIKNEKIFCVYFHSNATTKEVFYVGIGNIKRAYSIDCRSKFWKNIITNYGYEVQIIRENITWDEACEAERVYIKQFGRRDKGTGILVNHTDGGEGSPGHIGYWKGKKNPSVGYYNKLYPRRPWLGRKHTEESKNKMSLSQKGVIPSTKGKPGVKWTEERKAEFAAFRTGKKHTEDTKKKISEASKGKKKNYSNWNKGLKGLGLIKTSEETKLKLSKASKLAWEKRKAAAIAAC